MLKRLRFKNWRSLRDVTIDDIGPITVLIGANSSGKSNILDGLRFLRRMLIENTPDKTFFLENREQVRTLGADEAEDIEIDIRVGSNDIEHGINYVLSVKEDDHNIQFHEDLEQLVPALKVIATNGVADISGNPRNEIKLGKPWPSLYLASPKLPVQGFVPHYTEFNDPLLLQLFITGHWQLLGENFQAKRYVPLEEGGNLDLIDYDAANTVLILDYMAHRFPAIYEQLHDDIRWLMPHVERLQATTDSRETRLSLYEPVHKGKESPTVSVGTTRLIAMLTAYYALEMHNDELPGLVVIEEPDMAIHPQLLKNFVELIRGYTDGEHPRQFIFTTHNPRFLDHFQPEEVRVVHRDEQGYTAVEKIPDYIRDIWLDEYGLGEVWMTRSLGDSD